MDVPQYDLIADIGGTNARFALTDPREARPALLQQQSLRCAEFGSLQHAAEHYLAAVGARPTRAAIAVACPVTGDAIRLTNRAWSFSRSELAAALGLHTLHVLNDFGAVAWAIPALAEDERETLHGDAAAPLHGPVSVLGPGTGLGVAQLVGDPRRGWHVVETEGGHVSFAPHGEEEQHIARWLTARFGRTSNERLLSGAGLSHIDAALAAGEDSPTLADLLRQRSFELIMSSGFFGFYAHAGVIVAIEEAGLVPSLVGGSSAGALVTGLWAAGIPAVQIRDRLLSLR